MLLEFQTGSTKSATAKAAKSFFSIGPPSIPGFQALVKWLKAQTIVSRNYTVFIKNV